MKILRVSILFLAVCAALFGQLPTTSGTSMTATTAHTWTSSWTAGTGAVTMLCEGGCTQWTPSFPDIANYQGPGPSLIEVKNSGVRLTRNQLAPSAYVVLARMIGADPQAEEATLLDAISTAGLKVYDFEKVDGYLMRQALKRGPLMRWVWKPMREKDAKVSEKLHRNVPIRAGIVDWTQAYAEKIPMHAMANAKAILDQVPDAVFLVTDYEAIKPDPFLAVSTRKLLEAGKLWIIDQWDEPGFGVAPEPVKTPAPSDPPVPLELSMLVNLWATSLSLN